MYPYRAPAVLIPWTRHVIDHMQLCRTRGLPRGLAEACILKQGVITDTPCIYLESFDSGRVNYCLNGRLTFRLNS